MKIFKIPIVVLILVIALYLTYKYLFKSNSETKSTEKVAPALTESQLRDLLNSVHPEIQDLAGNLTTLNN